jgi:hypothetical protein
VTAHVYDAFAGEQEMGMLLVYPSGDTDIPAESFIWGGSFWNHYNLTERKMAADLLRLWRRFGFTVKRRVIQ